MAATTVRAYKRREPSNDDGGGITRNLRERASARRWRRLLNDKRRQWRARHTSVGVRRRSVFNRARKTVMSRDDAIGCRTAAKTAVLKRETVMRRKEKKITHTRSAGQKLCGENACAVCATVGACDV